MSHGNPRIEICNSCNMYGKTPRFSESKCPKCNGSAEQITESELKSKLGILIHKPLNIGFEWQEIKKQIDE